MPMMRHLFFLACLVPAMVFSLEDSTSAAAIGRGAARPFAGRPFAPHSAGAPHSTFAGLRSHGFNRPPSATPSQQLPHGADHGPAGSKQGHASRQGSEHGPVGSRQGHASPQGPAGPGHAPAR